MNSSQSKDIVGAKDSKYILNMMSNFFAAMFHKAYGHIDSDTLIEAMNHAIEGLLPEEIEHGLKEMYKQKYMPNFGAFRALCEESNIWKSPEDAWDEAIKYEKMDINHINTVVKRVSDSVKGSQGYLLIKNKKYFMNKYQQEVVSERNLGNRPVSYVRQNKTEYAIGDWIPCNRDEAKIHLDGIRHLIKG